MHSDGSSGASTACWSTRPTRVSTARRRPGPAWGTTDALLITKRYGSWVVLGTLVTQAEIESTPPLELRLRVVHLLRRRVPDGGVGRARHARLDQGALCVLDAVARHDPRGVLGRDRRDGLRLRHLSGRLPLEPRDGGGRGPAGSCKGKPEPTVSLVDWWRPTERSWSPLRPAVRCAPRSALSRAERARRARQHRRARTRPPSSRSSTIRRSATTPAGRGTA